MKIPSASRATNVKTLLFMALVCAMTGLLSTGLGTASLAQSADASATATKRSATAAPQNAALLRAWRIAIAKVPAPGKGCFQATYPRLQWKAAQCVKAPPYPQSPPDGPRIPFTVGGGMTNDLVAEAPAGLFVTKADGSFESPSSGLSESGLVPGPTGPTTTMDVDVFSLQLNTNHISHTITTLCSGAATPANCEGWEQFLFNSVANQVYIQYWLYKYNTTCPVGWTSTTTATGTHCFKNSMGMPVLPAQVHITDLDNLLLTGQFVGGIDTAVFSLGMNSSMATGTNEVNAATAWTQTEFNVFGDGWNTQAIFVLPATVVPRIDLTYSNGSNLKPICRTLSFTGETNNLSFGPSAPMVMGPGPAFLFTESDAGTATPSCMMHSTSLGDTHLTTFNGLMYDFQATGDFVLAQRGKDFVVQTRQVSGAPNWPNASVNSAVATRMGETQVAVCLTSPQLYINGETKELGDGESLHLPDGVDVWRTGNVFYMWGPEGDSVRAAVNGSYINVNVGLGVWPAEVSGLLANFKENPHSLATRDGQELAAPLSFETLYHAYADSWRVKPDESLLKVCGEAKEQGSPEKPFYANDLDPKFAKPAGIACRGLGIKEGPLLDACILDVAVIGDERAAMVYVGKPAPAVSDRAKPAK